MKRLITLCWCLSVLMASHAQRHEIYNPQVASLQVMAGSDWTNLPITQLGGNAIQISFDELSHDYHRYTYHIEHCEADWSTSQDIYETDYMTGYNDTQTIENYEQSINTTQLYTHYNLTIPNENCRLTMSGNYKLTVTDDQTGEKVLTACFMVYDPKVKIGLDYTTNTDIDINKSHQQVRINMNYNGLKVSNPITQIKTYVLQNRRWDNAVINPKPDYMSAEGQQWLHNRQLIFNAGNIYRKFELLDLDHPTMGIDAITWDGTNFHARIIEDTPRPNFVYDESAQGAFIIRNSDNIECNNTCDYAQVHFTLKTNRQPGEVYINGDWTQDRFSPIYLLQYDETNKCYSATIPLKQGYYSYQYLTKREDGCYQPLDTEGNFYQTSNHYDVLVYYRGNGDRTDQLIGWGCKK